MKKSVEQCLFKVNLHVGGHPSVTDEVDDPIFAFIWGKVQMGGKVAFGKNKRVSSLSLYRTDHMNETYAMSIP